MKFTLFPFVVLAVKLASIEPEGRDILKLLMVAVAEDEAGGLGKMYRSKLSLFEESQDFLSSIRTTYAFNSIARLIASDSPKPISCFKSFNTDFI